MKKTVTVYDKFSRLKDMLCPFPVQRKEKKMLTISQSFENHMDK